MKKTWVYNPKPLKLEKSEREEIKQKVNEFVETTIKLRKVVNRIDVKSGRIYLYHLVEQFGWDDPERRFIKPLIYGKYIEFPFARITIFDMNYSECTADWQRHNDQWIVLHEGSLEECLNFIEEDNAWYQY